MNAHLWRFLSARMPAIGGIIAGALLIAGCDWVSLSSPDAGPFALNPQAAKASRAKGSTSGELRILGGIPADDAQEVFRLLAPIFVCHPGGTLKLSGKLKQSSPRPSHLMVVLAYRDIPLDPPLGVSVRKNGTIRSQKFDVDGNCLSPGEPFTVSLVPVGEDIASDASLKWKASFKGVFPD